MIFRGQGLSFRRITHPLYRESAPAAAPTAYTPAGPTPIALPCAYLSEAKQNASVVGRGADSIDQGSFTNEQRTTVVSLADQPTTWSFPWLSSAIPDAIEFAEVNVLSIGANPPVELPFCTTQ